jgi:hypothetical protein
LKIEDGGAAMKLEDLGIDSTTRHHNKVLTRAENCFLGLLWIDHAGEDNKISADELAILFSAALEGRSISPNEARLLTKAYRKHNRRILDLLKRDVRRMQNHLLTQHENTPILSKAGNGGGYWIADSEAEADRFYDSFRQRGMVEMMTQLSFEFEDLVDRSEVRGQRSEVRREGTSTAMAVVDAFLEKMLSNPERYTEDLRKIGQKFGSILMPKAQVTAMQAKAAELQAILSGLTV